MIKIQDISLKIKYILKSNAFQKKPFTIIFRLSILVLALITKKNMSYKVFCNQSSFIYTFKNYLKSGLGGRGQFILRELYDPFFAYGCKLFNKKFGGGSILDLGCYPVSISNLIANIFNEKESMIPDVENVSGSIFKSEIDINAKAELVYKNGIRSFINVSINENLDNITRIFGSVGKIIITEPWLPGKESLIEIHKNDQIQKLKIDSALNIFASQIDNFNKNVEKKNLECDYPSMSIDNSVNCMQIMSELKNKVFEKES